MKLIVTVLVVLHITMKTSSKEDERFKNRIRSKRSVGVFCGLEPRMCCPGHNSSCKREECYCDEYCMEINDCCPDYISTCQFDIDDCEGIICYNGGTCIDGLNRYTCNCPEKCTGTHCAIDIMSNPCERNPKPCKNGAVCSVRGGTKYRCLCTEGYTGHNCDIDIDDCEGIICYNGGTCLDGLNRYTCNCPEKFTGTHCAIDPCKDNPCLNGGACLARGWTNFECICPSTFGGTTYKIDLCKPHPSDVVFVIDSSKSMGHHFFAMQKQFIKDLTRNWTIKEEYFQVAIVSFSSTAQIECDFGSITDVLDLKNKIAMLQFLDQSSRIDVGVAEGEQLLRQQTRQVDYINVNKIMIVITDGLTSSPRNIKPVSSKDITTFVVALGEDVSHYYLRKIAGKIANVLPPKPESLLNVMLSQLIHPVCNVCHTSNETDLIIMVDVSRDMKNDDITTHVPSVTNKLLSTMGVNLSSTRISLVTFDRDISMRFMFREYTSTTKYRMQQELSAFYQSDHKVENFTEILHRVNDLLFDIEFGAIKSAKKMILIISNFRFKINDNTTEDIAKSLHNLTEVFTIGLDPGEESFSNMLRLTSSSFHVGTVGNMFANVIDTFISAFVEQLSHVKCSL